MNRGNLQKKMWMVTTFAVGTLQSGASRYLAALELIKKVNDGDGLRYAIPLGSDMEEKFC